MNNQTTQPNITEADVVGFIRSRTAEILAKYPQAKGAHISIGTHVGHAYAGYVSISVHLFGPGFRECGIEDTLSAAEASAEKNLETPEKILALARENAARAANDLAELEAAIALKPSTEAAAVS